MSRATQPIVAAPYTRWRDETRGNRDEIWPTSNAYLGVTAVCGCPTRFALGGAGDIGA
jgi:hypothetical protein